MAQLVTFHFFTLILENTIYIFQQSSEQSCFTLYVYKTWLALIKYTRRVPVKAIIWCLFDHFSWKRKVERKWSGEGKQALLEILCSKEEGFLYLFGALCFNSVKTLPIIGYQQNKKVCNQFSGWFITHTWYCQLQEPLSTLVLVKTYHISYMKPVSLKTQQKTQTTDYMMVMVTLALCLEVTFSTRTNTH